MAESRHASARAVSALVAACAVALLIAAACGGDGDGDAGGMTPTATPVPETYTVERGDTLALIASRFGLSVAELVVTNEIPDPDLIEVGQILVIPRDDVGVAAGSPPPPLTCAEHRSLIDDALAAAALIDEASARGSGPQYAPYLDEIDRVSGLFVRRSEASDANLDVLLRLLARLAIDTTRLSLGQVTGAEAGIAETTGELRAAADVVIGEVCATSSPAQPSRSLPEEERPVHPSRRTGVA